VLYEALRDLVRAERPVALATIVGGGRVGAKLLVQPDQPEQGTLGNGELDRIVARDALAELAVGQSGVRHYGPEGQNNPEPDAVDTVQIFIESFAAPPRMLIFGAVDFTAALTRVAKVLGYRVIVCDARTVFATNRRFPMADEVIVDWPNRVLDTLGPTLGERDAVCVLTHDPKFDVPAIQGALATRAGYIGVMGSRKTHATRLDRLAEGGVTDPVQLARVMAPIGLDIGARSPEETAVSICAEIIALRTGRVAPSLRNTTGPIH
jgi:xanthine dehydrogenase accessory factor